MHIEIDRQAGALERAGRRAAARARAGAGRGRGLAADEGAPAGADRRAGAGGRGPRRGRGVQGAAGVDRRPPLHVPRLPRVLAHRRGPARRRGHRARVAARRRRPRLHGVRQAAAGGTRVRAGAASAGADEGQRALARAPAELPRLRRRQALRRRRQRRRRAALPRALHRARLPGDAARDPDAAPHRRTGARARRVPARQPRLQGAHRDHRHVPARRALPDERGRAVRGRSRHPGPRGASTRQAVPAHGPLRALRVLPGLHPARPLQHRQPGADRPRS